MQTNSDSTAAATAGASMHAEWPDNIRPFLSRRRNYDKAQRYHNGPVLSS